MLIVFLVIVYYDVLRMGKYVSLLKALYIFQKAPSLYVGTW